MLAIGLALFCLRYLIPAERWPEKWARIAFWSTNIGLAWMCFATLLPLGIAQLYKSVNDGYWEARDLQLPDRGHERADRVAAPAGRHRLHRRRGAAGALHRLDRHPPHRQARDARGARGHPVHRDRRSPTGMPTIERRGGRGGERRHERRGAPRRPATRSLCCAVRRRARVAVGAHAPALAPLPHRRLRVPASTTTPGVCPEGEHLLAARVRPRAAARALPRAGARLQRAARAKERCTDSDDGREIVRPLDPWPHSEAGRFHRGISLMLVALAALVAAVGARAQPRARGGRAARGPDRSCVLVGRLLLRDLRAHPANFPGQWSPGS